MGELERSAAAFDEYIQLRASPDWEVKLTEARKPRINFDDWSIDAYDGVAPDIEWLIKDCLPAGSVGLMCSLGGVGKSYLMLETAIRIAAGPGIVPQYALGHEVAQRGRVVMVTAEDSRTAIHRRLGQILDPSEHKSLKDHLWIIPLPDAGGTKALLESVGGQYRMTAEWEDMCSEIIRIKPVLSLFDPLQALNQADINSDPAAAQCWWSSVSQLCAETGSATIASHHMRKDVEIDGPMAARMAIRGTTSLVDGARWVYALWPAPTAERLVAEESLGEKFGPLGMIYGAVVKSNEFGMGEQTIYIRDPNSGLLLDSTSLVEAEIEARKRLMDHQVDQAFDEINRRWDEGRPFSGHHAGKERYLGTWLSLEFGLDKNTARGQVEEWITKGYLIKERHPKISKSHGVRGHR